MHQLEVYLKAISEFDPVLNYDAWRDQVLECLPSIKQNRNLFRGYSTKDEVLEVIELTKQSLQAWSSIDSPVTRLIVCQLLSVIEDALGMGCLEYEIINTLCFEYTSVSDPALEAQWRLFLDCLEAIDPSTDEAQQKNNEREFNQAVILFKAMEEQLIADQAINPFFKLRPLQIQEQYDRVLQKGVEIWEAEASAKVGLFRVLWGRLFGSSEFAS